MGYGFRFIILFSFINNAWSLPWVHPKPSQQKSHNYENPVNFSGVWVGQCDNKPAIDITIKHTENQFTISYGFMEENYIIGEMKTTASSRLHAVENNNTIVIWNSDHNTLIFINTNLFLNDPDQLNGFFSKVSMSLNGDMLTVKGQYYHTDTSLNDFDHETISCIYHIK